MTHQVDGDVLIVGGGLAGLSCAVFLGVHGVAATLVERHESTSVQPRARGQAPLTMEALRVAGVDRDVAAASVADRLHVLVAESLVGPVTEAVLADENPDFSRFSPLGWGLASQERVEPILRRRATQLGADLRFSTEQLTLDDAGDGLVVELHDRRTGSVSVGRWRYVVGADGPHSLVRAESDIGTHGLGDLAQVTSVVFEAELDAVLGRRPLALVHLRGGAQEGTLVTTDIRNRYTLTVDRADADRDGAPLDDCVRRAVGISTLAVRVLDRTRCTVAARLADRLTGVRTALVGDAAKVMPPTGGFGGNVAILDSYVLAWKLAGIVTSRAGHALLRTHDLERRPFAELITEQQVGLMVQRTGAPGTLAATHDPRVAPLRVRAARWRVRRGTGSASSARGPGPSLRAPRHSRPVRLPGTRRRLDPALRA